MRTFYQISPLLGGIETCNLYSKIGNFDADQASSMSELNIYGLVRKSRYFQNAFICLERDLILEFHDGI